MKLRSSWRGMGGEARFLMHFRFMPFMILSGYKHFVESAISLSVNDGPDDSDIQDDE